MDRSRELDLATLAYDTYFSNRANRLLLNGWEPGSVISSESGFSASVYVNGSDSNDVVISFRGTDFDPFFSDGLDDFLYGNISAARGVYSSQVQEAINFVADTMAARL